MASEEQKALSTFLKEVHSALRNSTSQIGVEKAWKAHSKNTEILKKYAQCMEKLATTYWEHSETISRIDWTAKICYEYFINKTYLHYREQEQNIANKMQLKLNTVESFSEVLKLVDVGSCYNPFKLYNYFDVFAIDLCPANESVLQCDFLDTPIGTRTVIEDNKVKEIGENSYESVTFCFLLEYIPTSQLRITACQKAYDILKPGGLLTVTTPDSKHVGANSKTMKCWRYAFALMGFSRIRYQKFQHMHCMAFRKCLLKDVAIRWANIHKEPFMEYAIHIPQDFNTNEISKNSSQNQVIHHIIDDFQELPFYNMNE